MRMTTQLSLAAAVLTLGLSAQAAVIQTIEFTAAEGYTNGNLNGQDGWAASSGWTVNTADGGSATVSPAGFRTLTRAADPGATLNLSVGQSVTMRSVVQLAGTPAASDPLPTGDPGLFLMDFGIGTAARAGSYVRLRLGPDGTTIGVAGDDPNTYVGMDIANATGRLAIDATWTVGTGGFGSTLNFQLINLDNNNATAVGARLWGTSTGTGPDDTYTLVTGTGDVGAYRRAWWSTDNTGVTGITMLSTDVVAAVPEPSALLLAGLGLATALGVARRRRRLTADIDR
jgi:hypothetical protein